MNKREFNLPFNLPEINFNWFRPRKKQLRSSSSETHASSRYHAYGRARLEIAQKIQNQKDWDKLWKSSRYEYLFRPPVNSPWKFCLEYRVYDFASEVGFWIDGIGLQVNAIGPEYAQFTDPYGNFTFAVIPADPEYGNINPGALRIQFMVTNIDTIFEEISKRNIVIIQPPTPITANAKMMITSFITPNGIPVDLWGEGNENSQENYDVERAKPTQNSTKDDYPVITFIGNPMLAETDQGEIDENFDTLEEQYLHQENQDNNHWSIFPENQTPPVSQVNNEAIPHSYRSSKMVAGNPSRWMVEEEVNGESVLTDQHPEREDDESFGINENNMEIEPLDNEDNPIEDAESDEDNDYEEITYEPVEDDNELEDQLHPKVTDTHFPNVMTPLSEKSSPSIHLIKRRK